MDEKRCHQCGRIGTRQFKPYPDQSFDFTFEGRKTVVEVGEWGWECIAKKACTGRWYKPRCIEWDW